MNFLFAKPEFDLFAGTFVSLGRSKCCFYSKFGFIQCDFIERQAIWLKISAIQKAYVKLRSKLAPFKSLKYKFLEIGPFYVTRNHLSRHFLFFFSLEFNFVKTACRCVARKTIRSLYIDWSCSIWPFQGALQADNVFEFQHSVEGSHFAE